MTGLLPSIAEFTELRPAGGFRAIYADPPWYFENRSEKGEGRNPTQHYACLPTDIIAKLPVAFICAADALLFMWATFPMLVDALDVIEGWGFGYVAGAAWAKESKLSGVFDSESSEHKFAFGTGYLFRSAAELLLVGKRGEPALFKTKQARSIRNLIYAPVREHSRKPASVYDTIEALTPGPYVELFSRCDRPGWDAWGNELGKFAEPS